MKEEKVLSTFFCYMGLDFQCLLKNIMMNSLQYIKTLVLSEKGTKNPLQHQKVFGHSEVN